MAATESSSDSLNFDRSFQCGLGWWNLYFVLKLVCYLRGDIEFHVLENLVFFLFLAIPLPHRFLKVCRFLLTLPLALYLLHYDSYLPPLDRLTSQIGNVLDFEWGYLAELIGRFLPPKVLLGLGVLVALYVMLAPIFRLSVVVLLCIFAVAIQQFIAAPAKQGVGPSLAEGGAFKAQLAQGNSALNDSLSAFFVAEKGRRVALPAQNSAGNQFDIVFLSVCSLSWDDLEFTGNQSHPLLAEFDLVFDQFNSVTSYSGPAVLRLSRASCGQAEHSGLYGPAAQECQLFEQLETMGYQRELAINHDGVFDGFLDRLRQYGGIDKALVPQNGIRVSQKAFAGSPIYDDGEMLERIWQRHLQQGSAPVMSVYNTTSLHDGNRPLSGPALGVASYKARLSILFDELAQFFDTLESSGRNVVVVLIPEHGAGLRGDKMQISGMREIPSPSITRIPVAVKLIGPELRRNGEALHIKQQVSFQALAQVFANIMDQNLFASGLFSATDLAAKLPETKWVSQNDGSTVMEYDGRYFISLDGQTWLPYPQ